LSFGGALIQRAEIIPFEPDADSADEGTRVLNDLKYYSPFSWLLKIDDLAVCVYRFYYQFISDK